jgi:hypothetical protein
MSHLETLNDLINSYNRIMGNSPKPIAPDPIPLWCDNTWVMLGSAIGYAITVGVIGMIFMSWFGGAK